MSDLYKKVEDYCRKNALLSRGDGVIVALSGGADSVFLFHALLYMKKKWELRLCAVHVNHGIRGADADADQQFCADLAQKNGVKFRSFYADIKAQAKAEHMTQEECGRVFRYECFSRCLREENFQKIAVGHHMDDQAETVLFQLFRGSSLRGLGGMYPKRDALVRPLLCLRKEEIVSALKTENISYCTDRTNEQDTYTRNQIRHQVVPAIEKIQPNVTCHLAQTAGQLQQTQDFVDRECQKVYPQAVKKSTDGLFLEEKTYQKLHPVIRRELILCMIEELCGKKKDITAAHIFLITDIFEGKTGRQCSLPYGLCAKKVYDRLLIGQAAQPEKVFLPDEEISCGKNYEIIFSDGEKIQVVFEKKEAVFPPEKNQKKDCTKCFDCDKMSCMPKFRFPQAGDYLCLDRSGKKKKLSRIFIDDKVPETLRKSVRVLAIGSHILWIPALNRTSAFYAVSDETKTVLFARVQTEEKEKGNHGRDCT